MGKFYYLDGEIKSFHDGSLNVVKIEWANGAIEYFENGVWHRDGGLPAVIHSEGTQEFWIHGERRKKEDGPAIIWANGDIEYFPSDT